MTDEPRTLAWAYAPWTDEQVAWLTEWQTSGKVHPLTCGRCRDELDVEGVLVPSRDGLHCLTCDFVQTTALLPRPPAGPPRMMQGIWPKKVGEDTVALGDLPDPTEPADPPTGRSPWSWEDESLLYEHADGQVCAIQVTCAPVREALAAALNAERPDPATVGPTDDRCVGGEAHEQRCLDGDCVNSELVVEALMEVGGWDEIDGDGTNATVLADHVRMLVNPERPDPATSDLVTLAAQMRANSERWFPATRDPDDQAMPLDVFYALGLAGEAGEVANAVKKVHRDGPTADRLGNVAGELADTLTYLLLLADQLGVDLGTEYERKVEVNERRWGRAALIREQEGGQ